MVEGEDVQSSVFGRPPCSKTRINDPAAAGLLSKTLRSRLPCLTERPHLCGETCSLSLQTFRCPSFGQPALGLQLLNV